MKKRETLVERKEEEKRRRHGKRERKRDRVEIEKNKIKNIRFFPVYQYFIPKTNLPMKSILIKFS